MPKRLSCILWLLSFAVCIAAFLASRLFHFPDRPRLTFPGSLRLPPATYTARQDSSLRLVHSGHEGNRHSADTTAVILNWSRFHNVRRIVTELCSANLAHVFREVVVWNNNPRELHYQDFGADCPCSPSQLRIVNSPENMYFYARYLACAEANSTYCFFQDDDFLVLSEVAQALHHRIREAAEPSSIYLLPPHERLSSDLRFVCNDAGSLHTSFAWLGYGAITHRSQVSSFLQLTRTLGFPEDEKKMADNYFSILNNRLVETWFDQNIELGGGQPFTVGFEGDERNKRHIMRAAQYLEHILVESQDQVYPFVDRTVSAICSLSELTPSSRTPCLGRTCVLESTISLLPSHVQHRRHSAMHILSQEQENRDALTADLISSYQGYPLSKAVDGQAGTAFRSGRNGRPGDSIMIDMLYQVNSSWASVEMAWLVDESGAKVLKECVHEHSNDGVTWDTAARALECTPTNLANRQECSVLFNSLSTSRYFRAKLVNDVSEGWSVYEVWIRGKENKSS